MAKQARWYKDGFILVTLAQSSDNYQHPRISVCRLYEDCTEDARYANDRRLPSKAQAVDSPTRYAETLISFEFQQNRFQRDDLQAPSEPWLKLGDERTSVAYGGHLDTAIRVESHGVESRDIVRKLGDVDKALRSYREKTRELGATPTACDASALMLALRTEFKLPVVFVVYRPGDRAYAYVNPDINQPTGAWIRADDERKAAH